MIGGSGDESRDLGTFGLRPKDRQIGVQISVATLGSSQVPLTMARNIQEGRRAFESPRSPTFCFTKSGVDKGQSHLCAVPTQVRTLPPTLLFLGQNKQKDF